MAKAKKKAERMITRVALVIDKSGSMEHVQKAALSGLNEQIGALRGSEAGDTFVTLIQFDNQAKVFFNQKNAKELKNLEPADYRPLGGTAMYDAVGTAIDRLLEENNEVENVAYLVIVISDGEENSSRRVTQWDLASRIKELQATGRWTFTYMLSNVDLSVAKNLGVWSGNIASWNSNTAIGTTTAYATVSNSTVGYLRTRGLTGNTTSNAFYNTTDNVIPDATAAITLNGQPLTIQNAADGLSDAPTKCSLGHSLAVNGMCFTCNPIKP